MEHLAKIVDRFYPITNFEKPSMLNVCGALGYVSAYYQEQIKFRNFSFQKNKKKETLKITKPNPLL